MHRARIVIIYLRNNFAGQVPKMNHSQQKRVIRNTEDQASTKAVGISMVILGQRRGNECLYKVDFASEAQRWGLQIDGAAPHIRLLEKAGEILGSFSSLIYEANLLQVGVLSFPPEISADSQRRQKGFSSLSVALGRRFLRKEAWQMLHKEPKPHLARFVKLENAAGQMAQKDPKPKPKPKPHPIDPSKGIVLLYMVSKTDEP